MIIGFIVFVGVIVIVIVTKQHINTENNSQTGGGDIDKYLKLMQDENFEAAIEVLKNIQPQTEIILLHLGECYQAIGNSEQALATYLKIKSNNKYSGGFTKEIIFHKIASLSYELNHPQQAFEYYMEILKLTPNDLIANKYIAYMAIGKKQFSIALPYIELLYQSDPLNLKNTIAYIITLYELKINDKLIQTIEELITHFPEDLEANIIYMIICAQFKPAAAIERYEKAINKVTDENILLLITRVFLKLSYDLSLENEAVNFLLEILNMFPNLSKNIRIEILYFISLQAIKIRDYDVAKKLVSEIEQHTTSFRQLSTIKQEISDKLKEEVKSNENFDTLYFRSVYEKEMLSLIPENILYQISNLATNDEIKFETFFDIGNGQAYLKDKYRSLDIQMLMQKYESLDTKNLLMFCEKTIPEMNYRILNKIGRIENNGYDFICEDLTTGDKVIICFKVWGAKANISDVFITELSERTKEKNAAKTILVSNATLTNAAKIKLEECLEIDIIEGDRLFNILKPLSYDD